MKPDFDISKLEKPCFQNHNKYQIIANCASAQSEKVILQNRGLVIFFLHEYSTFVPFENMKILVYLIRHGETSWNCEKRLQGQSDSPLTEEGIRQAKALAGRLSTISFDAVYSSDLERARQTVHIITSQTIYRNWQLIN